MLTFFIVFVVGFIFCFVFVFGAEDQTQDCALARQVLSTELNLQPLLKHSLDSKLFIWYTTVYLKTKNFHENNKYQIHSSSYI